MSTQKKALLIPVYIDDVDFLLEALTFTRSMQKARVDNFFESGLTKANFNVDHVVDLVTVCDRMIDKIRKYRKRYEITNG